MGSNSHQRVAGLENPSMLYRRPMWYRKMRSVVTNRRQLTSNIIGYSRSALAGRLVRIPMRCITNEYAFSMAPEGWNYFRSLLAEYEKDPSIGLEDTTFFRFFRDERVGSVRYFNDILFLHDQEKRLRQEEFKFHFDTVPWGGWYKNDDIFGGKPWGSHYDRVTGNMTRDLHGYRRNPWYQPGDRYPLEIEWELSIRLYHLIKRGYHPLRYNGVPRAVLLVRSDGEIRAVNQDGQHRFAILSQLGLDELTVEIAPDGVGVIREAEVEEWHYVKNGYCTPEQALEIFDAFFVLNGRERIDYLGLPSVY